MEKLRSIEPNRFYTSEETQAIVGETLFAQIRPVAHCKGRYWGQTLIDAMDHLGMRQLDYWKKLDAANKGLPDLDTCYQLASRPKRSGDMGRPRNETRRKVEQHGDERH